MDGAGQTLRTTPATAGTAVSTTCAYCGVGCGVLATPDGAGGVAIKGDKTHRANFGRLCSKGSALGETVSTEGRLLAPRIDGRDADWDTAIALVAERFSATIEKHGPDSVAFYVSGQLLSEDYYVANKLMKGYIGSANIDTNSRLCMASSVAGHKRAFGTDTVPGNYEDLEEADLIVLVGSNLAWCHPVLYQRIAAAKAARPSMKVVNIDPRRTATTDLADMHLSVAPGGDVAIFNALLAHIADIGAIDHAYTNAHIDGLADSVAAAKACDPSASGLTGEDLAEFCALWAGTQKVVTIYSQGVNQSSAGADKVNAIVNCHLATGRIGRPGMGPLSVTGQPNAMGGREVGGLANTLACHLDIENTEHRAAVHDFWASPTICEQPGLKAVDMFRAVGEGKIKALWVMCTNPAVSMPEADKVSAAIAGCEFVVVSDMFGTTDTAKLADVVLPATGWGEKDGTVTNSERVISRQRKVLPPPGAARHDWQIVCDVARAMGHGDGFDFTSPAEIFREYAALSGIAGNLGRDFDISGLAHLRDTEYDGLKPVQWPVTRNRTGGRFFGNGGFFTPNGKGRMLAITYRAPASTPDSAHPYRLNTGRVRDHWHTMTRTALSPRLSQHMGEPYLEVHPTDALALGLKPAHLAEVSSPHGKAILRVLVSDRARPGSFFAPMHWTQDTAPSGRIDALVEANTDPVSGQPESKATPVAAKPFDATWYGFAVSSVRLAPVSEYWATARVGSGWRTELAGSTPVADWEHFARTLFDVAPDSMTTLSVIDATRGLARVALTQGDRVIAALFAARDPVAVSRGVVANMLGGDRGDAILAGRAGADRPDPGAVVCSCFDIGVNTISAAIADKHLTSVDQIGAALNAGTNCGSCRPELSALLANARRMDAAE